MTPTTTRAFLATTALVASLALSSGASAQAGDRMITPELVPMAELSVPATNASANLSLGLQLDRANGQYRPGETLSMALTSATDGHVLVLNTDASGQTTVIYPNLHDRDGAIRAGQQLNLPGANANWLLRVHPPYGPNLITVIAMDRPIDLLANVPTTAAGPFRSVGIGSSDLARHLAVEMAQAGSGRFTTAQAHFSVTGQSGAVQPVVSVATPSTGFGLQLHADQAAYRIGSQMSLQLTAERDCALTVVNVSESRGEATVLYPNQAVPEVKLRAGETIRLPSAGSNVQLLVTGPAGPQTLYARCEADGRASLAQYQGMPQRGVYPVLTLPQWQQISQRPTVAQVKYSYTVLP